MRVTNESFHDGAAIMVIKKAFRKTRKVFSNGRPQSLPLAPVIRRNIYVYAIEKVVAPANAFY